MAHVCDESGQMVSESENEIGRDDRAASPRSDIQQEFEGLIDRLPAELLARTHMKRSSTNASPPEKRVNRLDGP